MGGLKNKLILVHYLNVSGCNINEINDILHKVRHELNLDESLYLPYFIPVMEGESRVECINPVILEEDQVQQHLDRLNKAATAFENTVNELNQTKDE